MDEDLKKIGKVLRDSVHLSNERIERYLEGTLDLESRKTAEDHLRACCYCAAELELIREAFDEREKQGTVEDMQPSASKMPHLVPTKQLAYKRLWVGYDKYSLVPAKDPADCLEVTGLSIHDILLARREDRNDPGSKPVAIEAPEMPPIVASLSDFQPVGDFRDMEKDYSPESDKDDSTALRAFAPVGICASITGPGALAAAATGLRGKVVQLSRKLKRKPRLEPILTYDAPSCRLEVLRHVDSGLIFLRVSEKA